MPRKKITHKKTTGKNTSTANKKKGHKKKPANPYENELKTIYQNKKGMMPDMTTLERKSNSRLRRFVTITILVLIILSIVAWSGFLYYKSKPSFVGNNVKLEISAPFSVSSGEEMTYKLIVKNNELSSLTSATLNVRLPNSFIFKDSNFPAKQQTGLFDLVNPNIYDISLPVILPQKEITVEITGQIIGEQEFTPTLSARLTYSPEDYSSSFEIQTNFSTEINDSLIALTTQYKNQVTDNEEIEINFSLKNISDTFAIENLKIETELPESFKLDTIQRDKDNPEYVKEEFENQEEVLDVLQDKSSKEDTKNSSAEEKNNPNEDQFIDLEQLQQKSFKNDNEFFLAGLSAEQTNNFKIKGSFQVEENAKEKIIFRAYAKDVKGDYNLQSEEVLEFQVVKGELLSTLIINGSDTTTSLNFDQEVSYLLSIKNKNKTALGDIKVRMVIDSDIIDWNSLDDPFDGITSTNQILWTEEEVPGLRLMLPEDEIEINFTIRTKPFSDVRAYSTDSFNVSSFYEATINKIDGLDSAKTIESNVIINNFSSNVELKTSGQYFDESGNTVGSGPIPPIVGQKTTYEISWTINNSLHELNDVSLNATLPEGVNWEFQSSADVGNVILEGDKVVWDVNRMPTSINMLQARFKASITPDQSDVNKILSILNETTLYAKDKETGNDITITSSPITTDVDGDDNNGLVKQN